MNHNFEFNERLGIPLPALEKDWEAYTLDEQSQILAMWEQIRAQIPDRIRFFERKFMETFESLNSVTNGDELAQLSTKLAEISSIINELNVWYREEPNVSDHAVS
jgi:hypothetical protein